MRHWDKKGLVSLAMLPLAGLYSAVTHLRRKWYKSRFAKISQWGVPIIVVGNITTGGTGKTPLVAWIVAFLQAQGYKPGIVSRGYKAQVKQFPQDVFPDSDPRLFGDEPVLLAAQTQCPVVISPNRVEAAARVIQHFGCDVVVSDDGLQHYRLGRSVEITVIDAQRQLGNGWYLPAGPLREGASRLKEVDFLVINGIEPHSFQPSYSMQLLPKLWMNVSNPAETLPLQVFSGKKVHAVAGIGNPNRFFSTLKSLHIDVIEHPFPDHHAFSANDLVFNDDLPIVMTEKDAIKCKHLNLPPHNFWYLIVEADLAKEFGEKLVSKIRGDIPYNTEPRPIGRGQ